MLVPFRSEFDPEIQGEGSIDPLGFATLADRFADWIFHGMTARMWRPRFLTAMRGSHVIVAPSDNALAADVVTQSFDYLAFILLEVMKRQKRNFAHRCDSLGGRRVI